MKILVAVPSYKGYPASDHSKSVQNLFLQTPKLNAKHGVEVEWLHSVSVGCPVLPRVRNSQVAAALSHGCDAILFIDDDIGFEPESVYRMLMHGVGVVGAVPQKRNHKWNDPPRMAISPHGLRVNGDLGLALPPEPKLPMALTLVATEVFRAIREAGLAQPFIYASVDEKYQEHMAQFFGYELAPIPENCVEHDIAMRLGWTNAMSEDGEDHYFCRRAKAAGYDTLIDMEVELRHWEGQVCHDYSLKKMLESGDIQTAAIDEAA